MNRNVLFDRTVISDVEGIGDLLYTSLDDFSYTLLLNLSDSIEASLLKYQNTIYVNELLNLYLDIINFVIRGQLPSDQNRELYLFLLDKLKTRDKKLVLYFLFNLQYTQPDFPLTNDELQQKMAEYLNESLFFSIKLMEISSKNYLDAYAELSLMLKESELSQNLYHRYLLLDQLAFTEFNADACDKAYQSMQQCLNLQSELDLGKMTEMKIYRRLGTIAYKLNKYEEVVAHLLKVVEYQPGNLATQSAMLYKSLEKINNIELLKRLIYSKDSIPALHNSYIEKKVDSYYQMKYQKESLSKSQLVQLEDYICSELKPIVHAVGSIFENIFFEDLYKFVSITKNYKKIYLFISE